jgi:iron-sulfur cluster assembly protein
MSGLIGIGGKKPSAAAVETPVVAKDQLALTERAAKKIESMAEREGKAGAALRVGIMGGGCSGLSYTFSFVEKAEQRDRIFEGYGQKLVVDPKSLLYLGGSVLDWQETLAKSGFVLKNPHEVKSCSCGESFSV